jgi:cold shock protein
MQSETGTVKWFDVTKGYGFIEPADQSKDVFIHISALERAGLRNLKEGQKIGYNIESKNGRTSAIDIKLI